PTRAGRDKPAAVGLGERLADRQAETEAAELLGHRGVALLEGVEDPRQDLGLNPDSRVDHLEDPFRSRLISRANDDPAARRCELDGVLDEVPEDLLDPRRITVHQAELRV